jgi:hypothetical protein
MVESTPSKTREPSLSRDVSPSESLTEEEQRRIQDVRHIQNLREQYWSALTDGPAYEAMRLQDELRLAQRRLQERMSSR